MSNWNKSFVLVDVSRRGGKDYWKLIDYLKENDFPHTDADFKEGS